MENYTKGKGVDMREEVIYTADDEEPNCNRCDNIECAYLCIHRCGAEHGWYGYERSELIEIEEITG